MSRQVITAVFDKVAKTYTAPQFNNNTTMAIRNFHSYCKDPNSFFNQFPTDWELHLIGYFNPVVEEIETNVVEDTEPMVLITAQACLELDKVTDKNVKLAKEKITESNIQHQSV